MNSRSTVLASAVLALAMMGDSLLYVALPLHAATFGVSLAWVAILLSANRVVRLFTYPLLVRIVTFAGLRQLTIGAALTGAGSTILFACSSGWLTLLVARIAWGIAFGALSLAALAYATSKGAGAGSRVGFAFAVRELGPIIALATGGFLVMTLEVRPALFLIGAISMLAVPLSTRLPEDDDSPSVTRRPLTRTGRPTRPELTAALLGLVADGVFPATIALLLSRSSDPGTAAIGAGTMIAVKRAAVFILSPLGGRIAEHSGTSATTTGAMAAVMAGTFMMASGRVVAGSMLMICGAAVATTAIPLSVISGKSEERVSSLARIAQARDAGAAIGPVVGVATFATGASTVVLLVCGFLVLGTLIPARSGKKETLPIRSADSGARFPTRSDSQRLTSWHVDGNDRITRAREALKGDSRWI